MDSSEENLGARSGDEDNHQDEPFSDPPTADLIQAEIPPDEFDAFDPEENDRLAAYLAHRLSAEGKLAAPKKTWVERATSFSELSSHLSRGGLRILELATAGVLLWFLISFLFWPESIESTLEKLQPLVESGGAYALAIVLAALRVPKMIESFFNRNGSTSNGDKSDTK